MKTLVDANGTHSFEWYSDGALKKDSNPAGGRIAPARSPVPDGWKATLNEAVDSTTQLATEYTVTNPSVGADKGKHLRSVEAPDGTVALRSTDASGDTTYTAPGGASTLTTSLTASPLFGRLAPVKNTTYTSGGMTLQTTVSRSVTPTGATYATMMSQTDTVMASGTGGAVTTASSSVTRTLTRTLVSGSFTGGSLVTTTGLGRQRKLTFDANGRITRLEFPGVDPAIAPVDLEWTNGFLTKVSQGARVTLRTYDTGSGGTGWLSSVLDPMGRTHSFDTYDLVGRVKTQTLPGALTLQTSYDAAGNLESVTPPGRSAHGFQYTARNQLDTYTAPDVTVTLPAAPVSRVTDYDYDLTGFLTKVTPPTAGAKIEFFRDLSGSSVPKGKLHRVVDSHGATLTYTYNPATGKITGITSESTSTATAGVSLAFGYDGALPTSTAWSKSGWPASLVLERTFDNHFRVASQKVQAGTASEVALRYDADGLLVKTGLPATVASSPTMTLTRNSSSTGVPNNGFLTGVTVGSIVDARTYNTFGEPKTYAASLGGTSLLTFDYEPTGSPRDGLGRIVKKTETVLGGPAKTVGYLYDTAGRLWKVTDAAGNVAVQYAYGANGTRTSKTTYSTPGDLGTGTTIDAEYDEQDRIESYGDFTYGFRDSGELAWKRDGSSAETTYTYDNRGNLLKVVLPGGTTIEYEVDALGRRVGRKVGTDHVRWIYDGQLRIVGEVDGAGNLTQFVYATRPNVPEYLVRGGIVYRILADHLGSVRLVVRATDGEVMQQMEYDEFGVVTQDFIGEVSSGVSWRPVPFGFAGALYDRDTKLARFGARDYEPVTGRWTAKDPAGLQGGLNLYDYILAEPINSVDPDGRLPWKFRWLLCEYMPWLCDGPSSGASPGPLGPSIGGALDHSPLPGSGGGGGGGGGSGGGGGGGGPIDTCEDPDNGKPRERCKLDDYVPGGVLGECIYKCSDGKTFPVESPYPLGTKACDDDAPRPPSL